MINRAPSYGDFPVDPDEMSGYACEILTDGVEDPCNALIIVAEQDVLEVTDTHHPRWNDKQRELILRAQAQIKIWEDQ